MLLLHPVSPILGLHKYCSLLEEILVRPLGQGEGAFERRPANSLQMHYCIVEKKKLAARQK